MTNHPNRSTKAGRGITLRAKVPCSSPDELSAAQRQAMLAYNDAAACAAAYEARLESDRAYMIANYGEVDEDILSYNVLAEPHAVLEVSIRGYLLRHNPNEIGAYLQCSDADASRAIDCLGDDTEWHATRYGRHDTHTRVIAFE